MAEEVSAPMTDSIVEKGTVLMQQLQEKIDATNIKDSVKSSLMQERLAIQSVLNDVFMKSGIINQSQLDSVNGVLDSAKKKLLQIQAQETNNNIFLWGGLVIIAIGGYIWYNKNK
jgi:LPXTG-motif cell wall-anchored protein